MRIIKKYANRKLYDMTTKRYISLSRIGEFVETGEKVQIIDNETGEDITASVLSQILSKKKTEADDDFSASILFDLLRKGSDTIGGYAKKYAGFFQGAYGAAEDEIEKIIAVLMKNRDLTENEAKGLRRKLTDYLTSGKAWVGDQVDERMSEFMGRTKLVTRKDIESMSERIDALNEKIDELMKKQGKKKTVKK